MEIRFYSIRELKNHIWFDRRSETFEKCLSILAENPNIKVVIKTYNSHHVRCLEDLRNWIDVYQGKNKTVNGLQLFPRCVELSQKYNVEFIFEHIPNDYMINKVELQKLEIRNLQKEMRENESEDD